MNKTRIFYLDVLKVLACVLVVFNHIHMFIPFSSGLANTLHYILFVFCKIAVPIFIMCTGALILPKVSTYKELFSKRITRILIPMAVLTFIFSLMNGHNLLDTLLGFLSGANPTISPHWFWYLYMLLALYLMTPFIQKMISSFENKDYKIFFIIFLLIPGLINFVNTVFGIGVNPNLMTVIFAMPIGYYVLGYYLTRKREEITVKEKNFSLIAGVIALITGLIVMLVMSYNQGENVYIIDGLPHIVTTVISISIFIIFKYYFGSKIKDNLFSKGILFVSNLSFGIYLFHAFFIDYLNGRSFMISLYDINAYLAVFVLEIIILIISGLITFILQKIPYVKKYV